MERGHSVENCSIRCRSKLFHLGIGGERAGAIDVLEIDHGAVAVLQSDFADESAERRLMVAGAENKWPEGPVHLEAAEGVNELFGVGGAGLSDAGRERFHGQVANDRTEPRIVVVALLISGKESLVLGRSTGC